MRLGRSKLGGARFAEPETSTIVTPDDFQDDPTSYATARLPYTGGEEAATVNLYPGLGGHGILETIVRRESSGHYNIRLDNFGILPFWRSAPWTQTLNEADSLTFEYPANAIHAASLLRPNTISLYDEFGELVQRFRLTDIIPTVRRDGNGVFVNVTARGLLSQFEEEWVTYYGPVRKIVTDIVDEFMAYYATVPGANVAYPGMTGSWEQYTAGVLINVAIQLQIMYDKLWAWSNAYTIGDATHADIQTAISAQHAGVWPVYDDSNPNVTPWPTIAPAAWSHFWDIRASITEHNAGYTIPEHVANLLGEFQESSQAVAYGEVYDPLDGTDVAVLFEGRSLMDCIRELFNLSGQKGQFTVTPGRKFIWLERLGTAAAVPIALGYNLQTLERRHDASEYATKLYVYGAGMSESTRIVAVRTSGSAPYVTKRVTVDNVVDQTTLDAYADELIIVVSTPALEYSINALDLAVLGIGAPLTIGSVVLVTDIDLGISASVDVFTIRKSLDTPLPTSYTLARRRKNLATLLKSLSDRIAKIEQRDDTTRIEEAVASGEITGVARVDAAVTAGTERNGDFRIDPETGRLQYVDLTTGEVLWQESPRINPTEESRQLGDFNLADLIAAAVQTAVGDLLSYVNSAGELTAVPNAFPTTTPEQLPAPAAVSAPSLGVVTEGGDAGLSHIEPVGDPTGETDTLTWVKAANIFSADTAATLPATNMGLAVVTEKPDQGLYYTFGRSGSNRVLWASITGPDGDRMTVSTPTTIRVPDINNMTYVLNFSESSPTIPAEIPAVVEVTVDSHVYVPGDGDAEFTGDLPAPILGVGYRAFEMCIYAPDCERLYGPRPVLADNERIIAEGYIDVVIKQNPVWNKVPNQGVDADIQSVGDANTAGDSTDYAPANHVHEGASSVGSWTFWEATTKTALTALIASENITAPAKGYVLETGRYYDLVNSNWQASSFLE